MKILVAVLQTRNIPEVLASFEALDPGNHQVDWWWVKAHDDPSLHRYDNITRKWEMVRKEALSRGYDGLLCLDDDQIVPPDALTRLVDLDSPVAYGLTVWRNPPHHWTAMLSMTDEYRIMPADRLPQISADWWGKKVEVAGCGMFCTLIRQEVLGTLPFVRRGMHCCDFYFSLDCQGLGFRQMADLGIVCGHWTDHGVLWPTISGYRLEVPKE